jgi:YtkA-like
VVCLQRWIFVSLLGACAILAGCQRSNQVSDSLQIRYEIAPLPPRVGRAAITVHLADQQSVAVRGAQVSMEGNMSHPGMPPTFGQTREVEAGEYRGTLDFTMPGDWAVLMHIALPGGGKVERQINVRGVLGK